MKKVVLKLDLHDDKTKQKAMSEVSGLQGVVSVSMDIKDKKLTVTGDVDPVVIVRKLRKLCHTEILSVVAPEKKKEEPKKDEPKKEEPKKEGEKKKDPNDVSELVMAYKAYNPWMTARNPRMTGRYHELSMEEDPNGVDNPNACVIC